MRIVRDEFSDLAVLETSGHHAVVHVARRGSKQRHPHDGPAACQATARYRVLPRSVWIFDHSDMSEN